MDKVPDMTKLPALIDKKRIVEAEYMALTNMNSDEGFEIADRLGTLDERIQFHSQTGMYAPKENVKLTGTYCSLK